MAGNPRDAAGGARHPRTFLESVLWRQEYTYEEMAARFDRLARQMGERISITPRHLRRLAAGERADATPATRRVLRALFDQPADRLLSPFLADTETVAESQSRAPAGSDGETSESSGPARSFRSRREEPRYLRDQLRSQGDSEPRCSCIRLRRKSAQVTYRMGSGLLRMCWTNYRLCNITRCYVRWCGRLSVPCLTANVSVSPTRSSPTVSL